MNDLFDFTLRALIVAAAFLLFPPWLSIILFIAAQVYANKREAN